MTFDILIHNVIKDLNTEIKKEKKSDKIDLTLNVEDSVKFSFKDKKEHKSLERQINKLELEKKEMENFFKKSNNSYELMHEKSKELENLNNLLDGKLNRWMELEELKNKV